MTDADAGSSNGQTGQPVLVHSGTYALWAGPDGGRMLFYRRLATVDERGQVVDIESPADEQLPYVPPEALPLVSQFLDKGIPPQVLELLTGKSGRLAVLRQLVGMLGQFEGADQSPAQLAEAAELAAMDAAAAEQGAPDATG